MKDKLDRILTKLKVLSQLKKSRFITWEKPTLRDEIDEYFGNHPTRIFLKSYGVSFKTKEEVLNFLEKGKLVDIDKDVLENHSENLEIVDEVKDWKDRDYQESYKQMQKSLLEEGVIKLPAPIFIKIDNKYYCYAGNRRTNLAFNNYIPLKIWLIEVE